jgi:hypothetical protein
MTETFAGCTNFDQDLGNWSVNNVNSFSAMFSNCTSFKNNGSNSMSGWTTSACTDMTTMFLSTNNFNVPIQSWNTSNVISMNRMFNGAIRFNQPIGTWDVSKVTLMNEMFDGDTDFNQPIGNWNVSQVNSFGPSSGNFMGSKTPSTFSASNLADIYTGWTSGGKTVKTGLTISFGTAKYSSSAQSAKNLLTGATPTGYGWIITDGGPI